MPTRGPLHGITILDLTQMMAGPFATQMLADLGADVLKVEKAGSGEWERDLASMGELVAGQSPFFLAMNRAKRSLAIDVKAPAGRAVVERLVARCDVVISNFRPGVMDRLGLSAERVAELNPDAVYVTSSGYGAQGPWRDRPGQDLLLQAVSGLAHAGGRAGEPPVPMASSVVDALTALTNVIAVLAGLLGRAQHSPGVARRIDVDMLSTALAVQCQELAAHLNLGQRFTRSEAGLACPWNAAPYAIYAAADGYLAVAMADLATVATQLGDGEAAMRLGGMDPFAERDEAKRIVESITRRLGRDEAVARLLAADVWAAPVLDFPEVCALEQVAENGSLISFTHPHYGEFRAVALPMTVAGYEPDYSRPAPMPGEHSREILAEAGFDGAAIDELIRSGVVTEWTVPGR